MSFNTPNEWIYISGQVISDLSSAAALTVPASADSVRLRISGQAIHVSGDGGDADTNDPIWDTGTYWLDNKRTFLVNFSAIESAASARIDIDYFTQRG